MNFFNKIKLPTIFLFIFLIGGGNLPAISSANWFDKFTNTTVVNQSSAWESQKRGYYSGGGVSIRTPVDRSSLINISLPRVDIGCGGIDFFWGGFSFLNPEYLIQKLKNILQKAPAYAFKLALQQLCQPCDAIITALEAIVDQLNQLALDDCSAAQALGAAGVGFVVDSLGLKAKKGDSQGSGIEWLDDTLKAMQEGTKNFVSTYNSLLDYRYGCDKKGSAEKNEKCRKKYTLKGSIWDMALNEAQERNRTYPLDDKFADLGRALYGDMLFYPPGDAGSEKKGDQLESGIMKPVEACPGAEDAIIYLLTYVPMDGQVTDEFYKTKITGILNSKDSGCHTADIDKVIGENWKDLAFGLKAYNVMMEIKTAMRSQNGTISNASVAFINQSIVPVYTVLNILNLQASSSSNLNMNPLEQAAATILALSNAYYVLSSLNTEAQTILAYALSNSTDYFDGVYANIDIEKIKLMIQQVQLRHTAIMNRITDSLQQGQADYIAQVETVSKIYSIRKIYQEMLVSSMRY